MPSSEADMWLDLVLAVVRKYHKNVEFAYETGADWPHILAPATVGGWRMRTHRDLHIVIHRDYILLRCRGLKYQLHIKESLCDPAFDPAPIIGRIEEIIIEMEKE
jgi:hypothetical protein